MLGYRHAIKNEGPILEVLKYPLCASLLIVDYISVVVEIKPGESSKGGVYVGEVGSVSPVSRVDNLIQRQESTEEGSDLRRLHLM